MANKKGKRPPWYRPFARAKYDAAMTTYQEFLANVLPPEQAQQYDVELPPTWRQQPLSWLLTSLGVKKKLPPGSGAGFVQTPYADVYTKVYGVTPIADLPKYRTMYRTQPDIQSAIELQTNMAIGRGFNIVHPDPQIQQYLTELVEDVNIPEAMSVMAHDCLVYGNAYGEILWENKETAEEQIFEFNDQYYAQSELERFKVKGAKPAEIKLEDGTTTNFVAQSIRKNKDAKIFYGIKPLDPVYMRVRRDSWGNIYGYIQWITFPPALIDTASMIHIKYRPKSWGYESLLPGTKVFANPSVKPIEELVEGEKVLTDNGTFEKIVAPRSFPYKGQRYKIYGWYSNAPIDCTWQHPILVKEKGGKEVFKLAKDLVKARRGDCLVIPIPSEVKDREKIDLLDFISLVNWRRGAHAKKGHPSEIAVDERFMRVVGYYLSEGFLSKTKVCFAFGEGDEEAITDCMETLKSYGATPWIKAYRRNPKIRVVMASHSALRNLFEREFGKGAKNKFLPEWVMKLPAEKQLELVKGFVAGDGTFYEKKWCMGTASEKLAYQLRMLLLRNKIKASVYGKTVRGAFRSKPENYYTVTGYFEKGQHGHIEKNRFYVPIRKIEKEYYEGVVWDIHVPNSETFVLQGGYVVHNSAYGTSVLMPLIKNNELLELFENDAAIWIHSRVVPPLIVKGGGDPSHPYTTAQMNALMTSLQGRTAASMIFVKSDVEIKELEGVAKALNVEWWLNYLQTRRFQALGVPPVFMGIRESANRASSEVVFQEFISRIQLLQELIASAFENQVLHPLVKAKFGETWVNPRREKVPMPKPRIVWAPIVEEDRNMRSQRLIQALQSRAISINEFRTEVGFPRREGEEYDSIGGPMMQTPVGTPFRPPAGTPVEAPKPPPEGVKKKEGALTSEQAFRVKKMMLISSQDQFKTELMQLVQKAKFELIQGDRLVKDLKKDILDKAKEIIGRHVTNAYLYGRMDVKQRAFTEEDLIVKQEELPEIAKLKNKFVKDFEELFDDMVKARSAGQLNTIEGLQ